MKKYISKILSGVLILTILSTPTFINGAEKELTDINDHWAKSNIEYLIEKGAISGYPDGTFRPNNTISRAEFVAIAYRSAKNGQVPANQGGHWATSIFDDARENYVIMSSEMPFETWNQPISRYEMAQVMVRITENILKEDKASTTDVAKAIGDYSSVQKQGQYTYYVEQAFMKGLIGGKDANGTFDGAANGSRAEASTMIARILEQSKRLKIDLNKVQQQPQGSGAVLNQTDENRPNPKVGDTFIKADGTKVVLKVGIGNVLGGGQGVSLYEGMKYKDGSVVKHGSLGTNAMGHPDETYLIDDSTGEGHWRSEWVAIRKAVLEEARKIQNPKEGQTYGNWLVYEGDWYWTGPINK